MSGKPNKPPTYEDKNIYVTPHAVSRSLYRTPTFFRQSGHTAMAADYPTTEHIIEREKASGSHWRRQTKDIRIVSRSRLHRTQRYNGQIRPADDQLILFQLSGQQAIPSRHRISGQPQQRSLSATWIVIHTGRLAPDVRRQWGSYPAGRRILAITRIRWCRPLHSTSRNCQRSLYLFR